MRQSRTSGSVGALGGQLPRATRRAPGKLVQGGCHVETVETLRRDPAGESPARQRLATCREPSVAWFRGDPSCEAYTGSEQAA